MRKVLATISDEAHDILKRYQKKNNMANLDTALDELLKDRQGVKNE